MRLKCEVCGAEFDGKIGWCFVQHSITIDDLRWDPNGHPIAFGRLEITDRRLNCPTCGEAARRNLEASER